MEKLFEAMMLLLLGALLVLTLKGALDISASCLHNVRSRLFLRKEKTKTKRLNTVFRTVDGIAQQRERPTIIELGEREYNELRSALYQATGRNVEPLKYMGISVAAGEGKCQG